MGSQSPTDYDNKSRDKYPANESLSKTAHDLKEQAKQGLHEAKQTLSDVAQQSWDAGRTLTREGVDRIQQQIQERPITSLVMAGMIGFLVGIVMRRN